jgi:hypothetical protein
LQEQNNPNLNKNKRRIEMNKAIVILTIAVIISGLFLILTNSITASKGAEEITCEKGVRADLITVTNTAPNQVLGTWTSKKSGNAHQSWEDMTSIFFVNSNTTYKVQTHPTGIWNVGGYIRILDNYSTKAGWVKADLGCIELK